MRTITCTIILDPEDGAFDSLTVEQMQQSLQDAIGRGYPLLRESEFAVLIHAKPKREPTSAECRAEARNDLRRGRP